MAVCHEYRRSKRRCYLSINVAYDPQPWPQAIENIAALRRRLSIEAPCCRIVASVGEIDLARAEGKIAVTFDIEGVNALNGRIDLVQLYYEIGVRHMLFAYNRNNLAGSGCHDEDIGLTDFGRQVIDEMNRVRNGRGLLPHRSQDHYGRNGAFGRSGDLFPFQCKSPC